MENTENGLLSTAAYWAEVRSIADEAAREVREENNDAHDALFEICDSHQWVIYTAYNHAVMWHTDNREAFEDMTGENTPNRASFAENMMVRAFYALNADACESFAARYDSETGEEK